MYSLAQTTAPTTEPLTLDEVKDHLGLAREVSDWDSKLRAQLTAARQDIEDRTNRQFVTATWTLKLNGFAYGTGVIYLPRAPLQSVTSITYLESVAGVSTTWSSSNYRVSLKEPGEVTLAYGQSFPSLYPVSDAVTIVYVAGYGAASAVPEKVKHAIKMRLSQWWAHSPGDAQSCEKACEALIQSLSYGDDFVRYEPEVATC